MTLNFKAFHDMTIGELQQKYEELPAIYDLLERQTEKLRLLRIKYQDKSEVLPTAEELIKELGVGE